MRERGSSLAKRVGFRLLAVLLSGTAVLLAVELGLRVLGYDGASERSARVFDPRYGTVNADSWIFDFAIDPRRHHSIDLRGQVVPLRKLPGERRVLFLGDSATEGAFVSLEQSYPLRFRALLREHDPETRVRVINAGVWGMTTIDEYHLLADKLLPLAPDVVVIGLFLANDLNFNLGHAQRRRHFIAPAWVERARQRSALAHFLFMRALALNQRYRLLQADQLGSSLVASRVGLIDARGLHMLSYPAGELALYLRGGSSLADEAFSVLRDVLSQFQELGKRRGFSLRVLLIPTPSTVAERLRILHHPKILEELREQGIVVHEHELDFTLPTRRVLAVCEELELACVDPTPELRRLGAAAFFPADEHPSVLGHEALARALLEP